MTPMQYFRQALGLATDAGLDTSEVLMAVEMCECPSQLAAAMADVADAKMDLGIEPRGAAWDAMREEWVGIA